METAEELYSLPLDKAAAKIEKFSDSIDLLDKRLDNAIGSKAKNKLIDKQTKEEKKTLGSYKQADEETSKNLKKAGKDLTKPSVLNSSDVSKKERKKIRKDVKAGKEIDLSMFKEGSKAHNAAVKYNEALKADAQAARDLAMAQEEYASWLVEASKAKFDNVADDYEKKLQTIGYQMTALDNRISEIETSGAKVSKAYYESQKNINEQSLAQLKAEKAALEESIKLIKQGTDEWHDAYGQIQQVSSSISDCVKEAYELNNAISQLHFDLFDDISDSIGRIVTEQEFLQGLFAHEKLTDDKTGNLTEAGIAKLGSLSASRHASKNNAEKDAAEVRELQRMFDEKSLQSDLLGVTFNSIDDLKKKLDETYSKWQDDIKGTYDIETEIADLMKERYRAELDALKELIDAKKEALDAEKDLHDYQKTLNEKTKGISTLQKQIAAYEGDTSEEGMAKLQKLQKELSEKQEDLEETEYDRYISDQKDMLDKLYEEYSETTEKKLEDFMGLVKEGLETADKNAAEISDFLSKIAESNGYVEETKGMFGDLSGSIQENVDRIIDAIAGKNGTEGEQPKTGLKQPESIQNEPDRKTFTEAVKPTEPLFIINENGKIEKNKGKTEGTVAPGKGLDKVRDTLKKRALKGFRKGGIARLVKESGEDGITLARNGEGFIAPEYVEPVQELVEAAPDINRFVETELESEGGDGRIKIGDMDLVPVKTDLFEKFINEFPEFLVNAPEARMNAVTNKIADLVNPLNEIKNAPKSEKVSNVKFGNVHYTFNLPNVVDENSFLNTMKNSKKAQECIQSFTVDHLKRNNKFMTNNIR